MSAYMLVHDLATVDVARAEGGGGRVAHLVSCGPLWLLAKGPAGCGPLRAFCGSKTRRCPLPAQGLPVSK